MTVTLSRKKAKSRTQGRGLRQTEPKAHSTPVRKTRIDLERELETCARDLAHTRERLAEATMQQAATSEMLRLISNSPSQSVLDAVAEHAARLCDANNAEIFRLKDGVLRLAASYGEIPVIIEAREGFPANRDSVTGRAGCDGRTIHVHDLATEDSEYPVGSRNAKREGHRTTLATPLLREGTSIGVILIRRWEVRPFHDSQIALLEAFARHAVIAIENVRLFEAEKQRSLALAQANRDLAEREAKIRRLVDSNVIGIFVWNFEGRFLEANDEFLRIVGYDREDLLAGSMRWTDLTPPSWRDSSDKRMELQKSSGRFEPFEKEYTRKDGSRVPVLIGGATFEEGGNEGVAFVLDLTERKRAEEKSRESELKLRQITETVPGLIWSNGPDGEPTHINRRMLDYSGLSFDEFKQRGWAVFVHPDDFPETAEAFYHAIQTGTSYQGVMRLRRADGEFRWHHARCEPLCDRQGRIVQWYGLSVDIDERERAEAALRESEIKLREIIETIPSMLWSAAPDGEPTYVNQRVLDYGGIRFKDFLTLGWKEFLHPEDFPETATAFYHAIQTGESYVAVHRLRRADGQYRWYHARGEPLRDEKQRVIQWYGLSIDIDERKRAEDALHRSEAYLSEVERLSQTGGWAVNRKGERTISYWSAESYRIFGFDPLQGMPTRDRVWQQIHPDDRSRLREEADAALLEKRDYVAAFRILLPDGTTKYLESNAHHLYAAGGELLEVMGTFVDVTEHRRSEQALRESEAKFRDYAETASDWFWEIDPDYQFTLLTENAFGSDAADRVGTPCWDLALDVETEPEKWRVIWTTLDAHESFRDFVYCTVDGSGAPMYVKASGKPVFDGGGKFLGYRGTGTDVTAIVRGQRAEASLQTVQAELAHVSRVMTLGQLTASIAHEVNQPIGSARNNARAALNFLDRNPPDLGEVREALGCIVADADRAGGIIDRIRDQIKKVPPRRDPFDLNRAIEEIIELVQSMMTENGVSVKSRLASGMAPVFGDRVQLQQVVLNLILNAVEAMRSVEADERQLLISTDQSEADGTLVAVRDSGPGIAPKHLEHVFEAFYSTKSGMGMGLSICRSIIAAHGGRLWAAAAEPGGALFQFTLPSVKSSIAGPFTTRESRKKTSL